MIVGCLMKEEENSDVRMGVAKGMMGDGMVEGTLETLQCQCQETDNPGKGTFECGVGM